MPATGPAGSVLAEPWRRILALILDTILLGIVTSLVTAALLSSPGTGGGSVIGFGGLDAAQVVANLLSTTGAFLYYALMIGALGQTLGGMLLKVRVLDQDGGPASMEHGFKRSSWILISLVPCVGPLASLVLVIWGLVNLFSHPLRQTPWDLFGRTVVVAA